MKNDHSEKQKIKAMRKKNLKPSVSFGIGLLLIIPIAYFLGAYSFIKYSLGMPQSFDAVWPTMQILYR